MTYTCPICGKNYSDVDKVTQCVMSCRDLMVARKNEEERKKSAEKRAELEKQIKHHCDEFLRLTTELYTKYPDASKKGDVYGIVWPEFNWSVFGL